MTHPMILACESAKSGVSQKEGGPFGAAIVCNGEVISVAHNTVLKDNDPTAHAEVNAIRGACKKLGRYVLDDCELYTTAEPCPMCYSAILWARIPKVYVGVPKEVAEEFGFDDKVFYEELFSDKKKLTTLTPDCESKRCKEVFEFWKTQEGKIY